MSQRPRTEDPSGQKYLANRLAERYESIINHAEYTILAQSEYNANLINELLTWMNTIMIEEMLFPLNTSIRRGIYVAAKEVNGLSPQYMPSAGWLPSDDELNQQLADEAKKEITELVDETKTRILNITSQPISWQEMSQQIEEKFDYTKTRADMIARTELMKAYNEATRRRYESWGIRKYRYFAHLNACTEPKTLQDGSIVQGGCTELHNQVFPIEDKIHSPPIHPNCYSADTEILTKDGFKFFYEVKENDLVATLNPNNRFLEYQQVKKTIKYHYKGEMVSLKARSIDLLVTPDHQIPYISEWDKKNNREKIKWKKAENLKTSDMLPRNCNWQGGIPEKLPLNIEISAFVRFMAWWLSDGSIVKRKRKTTEYYQISISQEDKKELLSDIKDLGIKFYVGKQAITSYNKELGEYLYQFGKSWQKFIPQWIKDLPQDLLQHFLKTYRKADGHIKKNKKWKNGNFLESYEYFTSSKQLANDLCEIILKSGNHASCKPPTTKPHYVYDKKQEKTYKIKHPIYLIRECRSEYFHVSKKFFSKIDYDNLVYCVEVPNHIIYVRRNGKSLWCGNCRCCSLPVLEK